MVLVRLRGAEFLQSIYTSFRKSVPAARRSRSVQDLWCCLHVDKEGSCIYSTCLIFCLYRNLDSGRGRGGGLAQRLVQGEWWLFTFQEAREATEGTRTFMSAFMSTSKPQTTFKKEAGYLTKKGALCELSFPESNDGRKVLLGGGN